MFGDVTSANIVGYANKTWPKAKQYYFVCSQFQDIGKEASAMTLGALVPNDVWRTANDNIKVINDKGKVECVCRYVNEAYLPTVQLTNPDATIGWYADTDTAFANNLNTKTLPLGSCVLMYGSKAAVGFTSCGQVVEAEDGEITLVTSLAKKYYAVGNCTPAPLTLGDFKVNDVWRTANDNIKIVNDKGKVECVCRYVNEAYLPTVQLTNPDATVGWYADTDTTFSNNLNSRTVNPGEGFLLYTSKAGITMKIPSAL